MTSSTPSCDPSAPFDAVVTYESRDGIALITMNRPHVRNAINRAMALELHEAWRRFSSRHQDRVAVLTGAGDRAFCAGLDLKDRPRDLVWKTMPNFSVKCDKPIICAVNGATFGAGSVMVMMADMAVAEDDAQFAYPEAKIGGFRGLMAGFPPRMAYKAGLEWILTGDSMTAQRAYEIGLINRIAPKGQALTVAMDTAAKIANNAPLVIQAMKCIAAAALPASPVTQHYLLNDVLDRIGTSQDIKEGAAALRDKRAPQFIGA